MLVHNISKMGIDLDDEQELKLAVAIRGRIRTKLTKTEKFCVKIDEKSLNDIAKYHMLN